MAERRALIAYLQVNRAIELALGGHESCCSGVLVSDYRPAPRGLRSWPGAKILSSQRDPASDLITAAGASHVSPARRRRSRSPR